MDCPKCGAGNPDSATFCSLCFSPFVEPEPKPAATTPDPTPPPQGADDEEWGTDREPDLIFIGGPDPVPVADCGEDLFLDHHLDARWVFREGDQERLAAMGLVGSATVRRLRDFYLKVIRSAEQGDLRFGTETPRFAREMLRKLADMDLGERIDQRQRDQSHKVDFIRRSTGEVFAELAPTEAPNSPGAYMQVYRSLVQKTRAGERIRYPEVVGFIEDVLPRIYKLGPTERIDDVREPDGRLALKVRSTGEILGYLPKVAVSTSAAEDAADSHGD